MPASSFTGLPGHVPPGSPSTLRSWFLGVCTGQAIPEVSLLISKDPLIVDEDVAARTAPGPALNPTQQAVSKATCTRMQVHTDSKPPPGGVWPPPGLPLTTFYMRSVLGNSSAAHTSVSQPWGRRKKHCPRGPQVCALHSSHSLSSPQFPHLCHENSAGPRGRSQGWGRGSLPLCLIPGSGKMRGSRSGQG